MVTIFMKMKKDTKVFSNAFVIIKTYIRFNHHDDDEQCYYDDDDDCHGGFASFANWPDSPFHCHLCSGTFVKWVFVNCGM